MIFTLIQFINTNTYAAKWAETYENIENPGSRLTADEIRDACEEGVSRACEDLLRHKIVPKAADTDTFYGSTEFAELVSKYCATPGLTCNFLMREVDSFRDSQKSRFVSAQTNLSEMEGTLKTMGARATSEERNDFKKLQAQVAKYSADVESASPVLAVISILLWSAP